MTKILSKREMGIQQTAQQVRNDIGASKVNPELPPFEKIINMVGKQVSLPPGVIDSNENIRKYLGEDSDSFESLKQSIKNHGILQSILIEIRGSNNEYRLICVEGHRRLFIAKEIGIQKVPCILAAYEHPSERIKAALATALKDDLSPIDRAEAFQMLQNNGVSIQEISDHEKKNVRTISRYIKMAEWPRNVKELIRQNPEDFPVRFLFQKLVQREINEQELNKAVQDKLQGRDLSRRPKKKSSDEENHLIKLIQTNFGLQGKVKIRADKKFLELEITDDIKGLISRLDKLKS